MYGNLGGLSNWKLIWISFWSSWQERSHQGSLFDRVGVKTGWFRSNSLQRQQLNWFKLALLPSVWGILLQTLQERMSWQEIWLHTSQQSDRSDRGLTSLVSLDAMQWPSKHRKTVSWDQWDQLANAFPGDEDLKNHEWAWSEKKKALRQWEMGRWGHFLSFPEALLPLGKVWKSGFRHVQTEQRQSQVWLVQKECLEWWLFQFNSKMLIKLCRMNQWIACCLEEWCCDEEKKGCPPPINCHTVLSSANWTTILMMWTFHDETGRKKG